MRSFFAVVFLTQHFVVVVGESIIVVAAVVP
jgi:hypothetical protein